MFDKKLHCRFVTTSTLWTSLQPQKPPLGSSTCVVKHFSENCCMICYYLFLSTQKLSSFLLRGCDICHVQRHLFRFFSGNRKQCYGRQTLYCIHTVSFRRLYLYFWHQLISMHMSDLVICDKSYKYTAKIFRYQQTSKLWMSVVNW